MRFGLTGSLIMAVAAVLCLLGLVDPALAMEAGEAAAAGTAGGSSLGLLSAGIAIGLAAVGGAYGQSKAISAALESIGRNPGAAGQMFLPWFLALVLIESLVIYAFVIALKLVGLI